MTEEAVRSEETTEKILENFLMDGKVIKKGGGSEHFCFICSRHIKPGEICLSCCDFRTYFYACNLCKDCLKKIGEEK